MGEYTPTRGAKKVEKGKYLYKGFEIHDLGYFEPEQRVCWEAHDPSTGEAFAHGYSKREVMWEIDRLDEAGKLKN